EMNASDWRSTIEPDPASSGGMAVRLGIKEVRSVGDDLAKRIAACRPYASFDDLVRRAGVTLPAAEALATAWALRCLGHDRRAGLWAAGATVQCGAASADRPT